MIRSLPRNFNLRKGALIMERKTVGLSCRRAWQGLFCLWSCGGKSAGKAAENSDSVRNEREIKQYKQYKQYVESPVKRGYFQGCFNFIY